MSNELVANKLVAKEFVANASVNASVNASLSALKTPGKAVKSAKAIKTPGKAAKSAKVIKAPGNAGKSSAASGNKKLGVQKGTLSKMNSKNEESRLLRNRESAKKSRAKLTRSVAVFKEFLLMNGLTLDDFMSNQDGSTAKEIANILNNHIHDKKTANAKQEKSLVVKLKMSGDRPTSNDSVSGSASDPDVASSSAASQSASPVDDEFSLVDADMMVDLDGDVLFRVIDLNGSNLDSGSSAASADSYIIPKKLYEELLSSGASVSPSSSAASAKSDSTDSGVASSSAVSLGDDMYLAAVNELLVSGSDFLETQGFFGSPVGGDAGRVNLPALSDEVLNSYFLTSSD